MGFVVKNYKLINLINIINLDKSTHLKLCPKSCKNTPYALEISCVMSDKRGILIGPSPPSFLALLILK